jgi:hypothetical protein
MVILKLTSLLRELYVCLPDSLNHFIRPIPNQPGSELAFLRYEPYQPRNTTPPLLLAPSLLAKP